MIELLGSGTTDFIVFGTGVVGKKIISLLEKKCHILFCIDNDQVKWESLFGKYTVSSPEEINKYTCNILVAASGKYETEMIRQLIQMGVSEDRICLCRQIMSDSGEYRIYPLSAEKIRQTDIPLIQYDLFHASEEKTELKKVMVLCSFFSVYAKQLIENMARRYGDIEFSLLTSTVDYGDRISIKELKHIYHYRTLMDLKTILEQLPMYDAMQLLWIEDSWVYCHRLIRAKTKKLNLNVGGSDFYRASIEERNHKRRLIEDADCITAETACTVEEFRKYYGIIAQKISLLPFGIEVLEYIEENKDISRARVKKKFGIPEDKIIVTCGHNANPAHQHIKIIEAVEKLCENIKKQAVFVFPMTYGQSGGEYIRQVSSALDNTGLECVILTKFMNFQEMAEYALISDIMLHVQTTDQLSSTMLEQMYAGSIVIAGSWLQYQSLHELGIYFLDIDTISEITEVLKKVILDIEYYKKKCENNQEIVWKHSAWDELAPRWHTLWE